MFEDFWNETQKMYFLMKWTFNEELRAWHKLSTSFKWLNTEKNKQTKTKQTTSAVLFWLSYQDISHGTHCTHTVFLGGCFFTQMWIRPVFLRPSALLFRLQRAFMWIFTIGTRSSDNSDSTRMHSHTVSTPQSLGLGSLWTWLWLCGEWQPVGPIKPAAEKGNIC